MSIESQLWKAVSLQSVAGYGDNADALVAMDHPPAIRASPKPYVVSYPARRANGNAVELIRLLDFGPYRPVYSSPDREGEANDSGLVGWVVLQFDA